MPMTDFEAKRILICALQNDEIGLNDYRQKLLDRVPDSGDWAAFQHRIEPEELVWLAAKTGDEFALLSTDCYQILLHGEPTGCKVKDVLLFLMAENRMQVIAKGIPGNLEPEKMAM